MARPSQLEPRIAAILDPTVHASCSLPSPWCLGWWPARCSSGWPRNNRRPDRPRPCRQTRRKWLPSLIAVCGRCSRTASGSHKGRSATEEAARFPEIGQYFDAGSVGDWKTRRPAAAVSSRDDDALLQVYWLAAWASRFWKPGWPMNCSRPGVRITSWSSATPSSDPFRTGSIYFGGTDAGRGIVTALSGSPADADPFFILTQNALADTVYLQHLRDRTTGESRCRIRTITSGPCSEYFQDAIAA
jgi:hypothetical protein